MNLPNKLTFSRLVLTPIGFFVFYFSTFKTIYGEPVFNTTIRVVLSVLFFLLLLYMEISDLIDGKIARKNGLVTDLGKVFDPFSDMFMHMSVFFAFVLSSFMPFWAFLICLYRELIMLFMRNLLSSKSVAFPANIFGKAKTMFFAITTFIITIYNIFSTWAQTRIRAVDIIVYILCVLCAVMSLLSLVIYLINIKKSHILDDITR